MNVPVCKSLGLVNRRCPACLLILRRSKYKKKWAVNLPSKTSSELALQHFDAFYKPHFGRHWPSIRVSLLSLPKYAAVINNASDAELSAQVLANLGAKDVIREASVSMYEAVIKESSEKTTSGASALVNNGEEGDSDRLNAEPQQAEQTLNTSARIECSLHSLQTDLTGSREDNVKDAAEMNTSPSQNDFSDSTVHRLKNVFTPDQLHHSSDLKYFVPTEQVFSEKEELLNEEYAQSVFEERPIAVSVLPGETPRLPTSLKVMTFPPGNVSDFPKPKVDNGNVLNYYLLDAASIFPVLALNLSASDNVLDLCAAPGGKTLTMLQMIISQGGHLVANDSSGSRVRRLRTVLRSYLPPNLESEYVTVTARNGLSFSQPLYSKVLVDVPCNSDRHVLLDDENNLFKPGRIKDRLKMTTLQKDLLLAGIRSCKPGGSVVYSTCTLAAVQNDGVVQAAVEELWETSDIDVAVEDLSPLKEAFLPFMKFHTQTRFGQLILPSLTNNFGPMYFCKLKRLQ